MIVQSLIAPEVRPVVKHAQNLLRTGCSDASASEAFASFSYTELSGAGVLPNGLTSEEFSVCEYLPHLQQVLFSTEDMDENVTYESFVVIPDSLNTSLYNLFGNDVVINGQFVSPLCSYFELTYPRLQHDVFFFYIFIKLLENFGQMSLRRFITFVSDMFSTITSGGRRLKRSQKDSPAMMRGALMRAARRPNLHSQHRALQTSSDPLFRLELDEIITLTFDFNFGDGEKDLLLGVQFLYNSDDSVTNS